MSTKILDKSGLAYFWTKIKAYVAGLLSSKADDSDVVHKAGDENVTGTKTFVGSKKVAFKQSAANDKLGFTLYNNSNVEQGYLEYNPTNKISGVPLMTLGNYATAAAGLAYVGFRKYSNISGAAGAYNLLTPLISDAKAPFNLTTTYTNFFLPLGVTDGTTIVVTDKSGLLDISSLLVSVDSSDAITAMTGYSKPSSGGAIAASDSLNTAIGKLEFKVDSVDDSNYVHLTGNETVAGAKTFSNTISGSIDGNAATASAVAWSGVTSKPTTIAGYGITDAKIVNGTITLGSASITPLTSHQTLPTLSRTISGSGNAITDITVSDHAITATKGTTFLTSASTLDAAKLSGTIPSGCYTNTTYTAGTGLSLSGTQFSLASHTHDKLLSAGDNVASTSTNTYASGYFNVRWFSQADKVPGQPGQYGFLATFATGDNASEVHQIWCAQNNGDLYHRGTNGSSYASPPAFKKLIDSSNETQLSLTNSGSGNAVTGISVSGHSITATKGSTFLTSHQDISGKVNKSGDMMTGDLTITTGSANQIRLLQGNYSILLRNDGWSFWILQTASGDPWGSWNDARPFYIDLSSGLCYINGRVPDPIPVGSIIYHASSAVPANYLICNGGAVSRTTYASLFAVIGTTYGAGDGWSTFNVPNLIDRFPQGNATPGTVKAAGIPNIISYFNCQGTLEPDSVGSKSSLSDNYVFTTALLGHVDGGSSGSAKYQTHIKMDLSKGNSIYGKSSTVQPPALTLVPCIRYA